MIYTGDGIVWKFDFPENIFLHNFPSCTWTRLVIVVVVCVFNIYLSLLYGPDYYYRKTASSTPSVTTVLFIEKRLGDGYDDDGKW